MNFDEFFLSWLLKMMSFSKVQSASSQWAWDPRLKKSSTDPTFKDAWEGTTSCVLAQHEQRTGRLPAQPKEPLICHDIPQCPWEKIGCDIFTLNNRDYLCTVDYYSDYFEVDELHKAKTGAAVIGKLKKRFAMNGIPDTFHSDNGPLFNSNEFSAFAVMYEFEDITSSPEYPQSNGKVENAVKTSKNLMKKSATTNSDFQLALLDWRNTPTEGMKSSPAQRMFRKRTRTLLTTSKELLEP